MSLGDHAFRPVFLAVNTLVLFPLRFGSEGEVDAAILLNAFAEDHTLGFALIIRAFYEHILVRIAFTHAPHPPSELSEQLPLSELVIGVIAPGIYLLFVGRIPGCLDPGYIRVFRDFKFPHFVSSSLPVSSGCVPFLLLCMLRRNTPGNSIS